MTTLTMRPMTAQESAAALVEARVAHVEELKRAEAWSADAAQAKAEIDWAEYPAGSTPYVLEVDDRRVGRMLLGMRTDYGIPFGYIYGIYVDPDERGRGFGREAIRLAEEKLVGQGASEVRLRVWGDNYPALRLYEQLGFKMTSLHMRKTLV